jgi:hypothetical protein
MTGFGLVRSLPGIWPSLHLDTAITLPIGVEAYAAYALRAKDKPLELLSGSNLLYLLNVHASVDAKIEPPEHWVEPKNDTGPAHWDEPPSGA